MGDARHDTIVNAFSGGGGANSVFGGHGNDRLSFDTADENTEVTLTLFGASVSNDFQGLTGLNASAIKLFADEVAVAAGASYQTLAKGPLS